MPERDDHLRRTGLDERQRDAIVVQRSPRLAHDDLKAGHLRAVDAGYESNALGGEILVVEIRVVHHVGHHARWLRCAQTPIAMILFRGRTCGARTRKYAFLRLTLLTIAHLVAADAVLKVAFVEQGAHGLGAHAFLTRATVAAAGQFIPEFRLVVAHAEHSAGILRARVVVITVRVVRALVATAVVVTASVRTQLAVAITHAVVGHAVAGKTCARPVLITEIILNAPAPAAHATIIVGAAFGLGAGARTGLGFRLNGGQDAHDAGQFIRLACTRSTGPVQNSAARAELGRIRHQPGCTAACCGRGLVATAHLHV
ncbi:MAG: hypothetical protein UY77_C0042G0007, partial [Candidatus Uhrbacteria bacterium GW2011_GWA2_53_10]